MPPLTEKKFKKIVPLNGIEFQKTEKKLYSLVLVKNTIKDITRISSTALYGQRIKISSTALPHLTEKKFKKIVPLDRDKKRDLQPCCNEKNNKIYHKDILYSFVCPKKHEKHV